VGRGSRRSKFTGGLGNRTPLVLVAAALAVVGALAGLQVFVARQAFVVIPEERLLRTPNDDYVHVSFRVADLKKHPPSLPVVYLFGGSGTMELMRSERALSDAVTAAAGTPVEVVDLAAHDQSPGQTLAILDNLPASRGLLAVGVAPNRLTASPQADVRQLEGRPLALTSPHLAGLLAGRVEVSRRLPGLLPGILDFAVSYARWRASLSSPWLTSVARADHYYADDQIADMGARIAGSREELVRERGLYGRYASYNLAVLAEIVRLGRERGFTVALFEQPLAPEASGPEWSAFLARYRASIRELARREGVPYIDVQPQARLRADDFADFFHLRGSGRDKWTAVFAPSLAKALAPGQAIG
jgi:hypothetical protein